MRYYLIKNKFLSAMLVLALFLTLLPITAYADVNPDAVCEINGAYYDTLDAALATISAGESKTITLLKSINYYKGIYLNNKKVTFDLNGYILNINNPAEGGAGLDVLSGSSVTLSGLGALNVTGKAYGVRVTSNALQTYAIVTNATATGAEGRAAYAAGPATITVLEDATVTGIHGYGIHAISGARIVVKRDVNATNDGVYASDSHITVDGSIVANDMNLLGDAIGIGVVAYGRNGSVEVGGNVTANRIGAKVLADGSITIDGILTAPGYIQFADNDPTAIDNYISQTTKEGYRTYQHQTAGTVWIKGEMPATTFALTVTNGTGNGSFAENEIVAITANPAPAGQRFREWCITPSVTFADSTNKNSPTAKFVMPAQPVTATAVYEASEYTITVQNDGNGMASANFNSAAEGTEVTLTAIPNSGYRFKEWQVISGNITIIANKFNILDSNVTVKAIFEPIPTYAVIITGGTGGGYFAEGETVVITANPTPSGKEFDKWTTSDGITFENKNAISTSFIMPAKTVSISATYKDLPLETFAVNVLNDGNGTANANVSSAQPGDIITLTALPNKGYRFKAWEVISGGVYITENKFIMPSNTVTIKAIFEKIPNDVSQYKIIRGANSSWETGTNANIEITCNGDFSKFIGLKIDGVMLGTENYTAVSGSTIVTLKAAYIETLAIGEHTLEFLYEGGSVQTEFTILAADDPTDPAEPCDPTNPTEPTSPANPTNPQIPATGGNSNMAFWFVLLFITGCSVTLLGIIRRKHEVNVDQ
jgi:hypothetical protein